jgi:DNA repair exonuclease SbcCD ATPase subunit
LDAEGNTQPDPAKPGKFVMEGKGTAAELTKQIIARARSQKDWLKETRATLKDLRTKYQQLVEDYNLLPPVIIKHLNTIKEKEENIKKLEEEKARLEDTVEQLKKDDEWTSRVTYENVVEQIASNEDASKRDDARKVFEPLLKRSQVTQLRRDIKRRVKEVNDESGSTFNNYGTYTEVHSGGININNKKDAGD